MNPEIRIGNRLIGERHPCFIIAEAGVNHNGSLDVAKKLVDIAATAGADAVKFQKRSLPSLYPRDLLENPNLAEQAFQYMIPLLQKFELLEQDFLELRDYCRTRDILFLCTAWDEESVDVLDRLEVPAFKLGSPDLTNLPLIDYIARKGKPLILSTGMSLLDEIETTVQFLKSRNLSFALLHCNSTYPAPFEDVNLLFMERLKECGVPVGYSGHERGIAVSTVAVARGASILEKHITLDRTMVGPDHAASLEPAGFEKLVRDVRIVEIALGDGVKRISTKELQNREVLGKSLAARVPIANGVVVKRDMIKAIGPGKGLSPQRIDELVGWTATRDLRADDLFLNSDLDATAMTWEIPDFRRGWGFKTRLADVIFFAELQPSLVEHHFSDKDLSEDFQRLPLSQRLFVHAPEFWGTNLIDLCSCDEKARTLSVDVIQRTIDKVRQMAPYYSGPATLVVHVGGMSMDEPDPRTDRLYTNALDSLSRLNTEGVVLLPENLPPRPWYFGGQWCQNAFIHPEEIVEFCRRTNLKMCFDICHAQLYCNYTGRQLKDYIELVKPYIAHMHISDAAGIAAEGLQIGEGQIDFAAAFAQLQDASFTWVPEIWRGHNNQNEGFATALKRLARYRDLL